MEQQRVARRKLHELYGHVWEVPGRNGWWHLGGHNFGFDVSDQRDWNMCGNYNWIQVVQIQSNFQAKSNFFKTLVISSKFSPFFSAQKLWCFTRHRHDFLGKANPHDCSICWTSMLTSSRVLRETEDLDKLRLMRRSKKKSRSQKRKSFFWGGFSAHKVLEKDSLIQLHLLNLSKRITLFSSSFR